MRKPHVCLLMAISLATIATTLGCSNAGNPTYTKLAFNSDRKVNPVTNLFLMDLDGSNVTPVPFNNGIYSPSSSADLTTIAFDSAGSYWVSNASGSAQTQLANAGSGFAIRVAPNGKKLILMAADPVSGAQHVWVMNVDGTGALDLNSTFPSGINACFTGSFSADSAKIVLSCTGPVLSGIYTIKPDGTGLATVTTQGNFVDTPGFTPDGKKILFVSYSLTGPSTTGIVSVNLDGSGLTVLVNDAFEMEILNANLYYTLFDPVATNDRIYKSNLDGTGAVALTDGSSSDSLSLSTD